MSGQDDPERIKRTPVGNQRDKKIGKVGNARKTEKKKETRPRSSRLLSFEVCRKCTYPSGKVDG